MALSNVDRIDDRRAGLFHFGDRLVGDANVVSIGEGRFDHEITHHAQTFSAQRFSTGETAHRRLGCAAQAAVTGSLGS